MSVTWVRKLRDSDQWSRFRANRLGYWSLWIFVVLSTYTQSRAGKTLDLLSIACVQER